ncbi:MAG: hypothetical protein Q8868_09500 [Bacteroidota bacterium]|nr:hypothetical protein [Bacteroidota bacterium]
MKKKDPKERLSEAEKMNSDSEGMCFSDDEVESIRKINQLIDEVPVDEPSSSMDSRFYEMLEDESREALTTRQSYGRGEWLHSPALRAGIRIAAGIALFLMGWFMSSWLAQKSYHINEVTKLSGELKDLREALVLTMLNQASTLERIKAVNMVNEFENADDKIIEGLLGALNSDNNDNVRLLSLEALLKYSDNPAVREGLVASIKNQLSPVIQLRLAEVMVTLDEKRAAPEFQKILTNAGLNYMVRNKINEAVTVLL